MPLSLPLRIGKYLLVLCFAAGLAGAVEAPAPSVPPAPVLDALQTKSDTLLARADLAAYRGWLKYLAFVAHNSSTRKGATSEAALAAATRWQDWLGKIEADPQILAKLRGVQEWAYESPVDDSGQPFKLVIPDDYDAAHPAPLSLYMHGATGNHLDHSSGFHAHGGYFELAVLGRSRIGGYTNLSEADVLQSLAYVRAHWAVDGAQIHLAGGSMGGMGTFRLGSRYPQLWASGVVTCGAGDNVPAANLLTLPLYVMHSIDDPVVPVLQSRSVVQRLQAQGGLVIHDETNGLGHAAWDYKAGQGRSADWAKRQILPASRSVVHIDYTATDSVAARGWWVEVQEWGDSPQPARIVATVGPDNSLYLVCTNLAVAKFHLDESPLDAALPLTLSVNGEVPLTIPAPLPAELFVQRGDSGWTFATNPPAGPARLHAPGGPSLLYAGEPLLIVYGTGGDDAHRTALRVSAEAASRSPGPAWATPPSGKDELDADGIPQAENLYGALRVKADRDVTDDDLARSHLVLLGTAAENSIVARIAAQLPVALDAHGAICSDGEAFTGDHLALGLVYYNPLAPTRLIFWVAAHDAEAYGPDAIVPLAMAGRINLSTGVHFGADLLISRTGPAAQDIVATRGFTSRWQWTRDRAASPLLPESFRTYPGLYAGLANIVREQANTDLALLAIMNRPTTQPLRTDAPRNPVDAIAPGITRVADLLAQFPQNAVGIFEISGADLKAALQKASTPKPVFAVAGPSLDQLEPSQIYTVALPTECVWWWNTATKFVPVNYRQTELTMAQALQQTRFPASR